MEPKIVNSAGGPPFSFIVHELLAGNIAQSGVKRSAFMKLRGIAVIDLPDIEASLSLHFQSGSLTIEPGISPAAAVTIRTSSDRIMDLNAIGIRRGLPWFFDEQGRKVLGLLFTGEITVRGLLKHPIFLARLTLVMSVM